MNNGRPVNTPASPREQRAERLRPIVREAVEKTSLRHVAAEAGVSHTLISNFLDGSLPQPQSLRKLEEWAERHPEYVGRSAQELLGEGGAVVPPNYEGLGIEIPERDRLKPGPMRMFDRFVHRLLDMGLGREDIEHWGRTVLAPIAHLNTLHKGREVSEAATEEEQTWILEHNIQAVLRVIERRRRG